MSPPLVATEETASANLTALAPTGSAVSKFAAEDSSNLGMLVRLLDNEMMVEWLWCWNGVGEMEKFQERGV